MTTKNTSIAEEQAEKSVRARWQTDTALRAEFGNDLGACVAIHKAEARGVRGAYGSGNVTSGGATPATQRRATAPAAAEGAAAGSRNGFRVNSVDKAFENNAREIWKRNPGLDGHANFESYYQARIRDHASGTTQEVDAHG